MFRKPFHVKSSVQLKSSEKKRLKERIKQLFLLPAELSERNNANEEQPEFLKNVFLPKGDGTVVKIHLNDGQNLKLYASDKVPLFVELDDGSLIPTVFAVWRHEKLLSTFLVSENILKRLQNGADVMLPGLISLTETYTAESLGNLPKDAPCAISLVCNEHGQNGPQIRGPIAIGRTLMSSDDMVSCGMKGKGIQILHIYRDYLYEFGPSELPPYADLVNFLPFSETVHLAENQEESLACEKTSDNILDSRETGVPSVSEVETEKAGENGGNSGCEETEDEKAAEAGETFEGDRAAGEILEEEETPEGFLYRCFLVALKTRLQKEQLPILVNNFFYQCLLPVVSGGRKIEMKETRYKKVGVFLEEMAKMGLIELEEKKKGVLTISGVNWASEELKSLEISDEFLPKIEDTSQQNSAAYVAPVIEEFYAITAAVLPLFQKQNANLAKGDLLKATEIRQIVTDYVKSDEFLQRENRVMLDDFLFGMLGGKERLISWNALFDRVYKVMTKSYRLTWPDGKSGRSLVRKTPLPLVELEVVQRAANKRVTLVNSLSTYGIKAEEFAKKIQTGLSCGATVSKDVPKSEGPQVQVQGNQVAYIGKILLEEYKLPRKYVKGLDLAVKKKKK